jgi:VWFA-related protein
MTGAMRYTFLLAVPLLVQQLPLFRSGVDIVAVDVSVVDDRGRPITTLQTADFILTVDGEPRPIVSAEYVAHRSSGSAEPQPSSTHLLHVGSNAHVASGRVILIAVDQQNIRRADGGAALQAASRFIERLDPADRLAAVGVGDPTAVEFTADHEAVRRRLLTLRGTADTTALVGGFDLGLREALGISDGELTWLDRAVQRICGAKLGILNRAQALAGGRDPCPMNVEQQSRAIAQYARAQTRQSIAALTSLVARLEDIEGPKTVVLLSEGLLAEPRHTDFTALAAAAQRARVTLYVLHTEPPMFEAADDTVSPTSEEDFKLRADGLVRLAATTGGARFTVVGTGERVFDRVLQELSGYYLLAFEASASDLDGRPHRIAVSVRAPRATVRSRAAFQVPVDRAQGVEPRLLQLLRTPRIATEVALRAAAYRLGSHTSDDVRALVTLETDRSSPITFGVVIVDERGVVATSAIHRSDSGTYAFETALHQGRYTLRAAAIDPAGRAGSLEHPLDIHLPTAGALRTSDLVLAEKPASPDAPLRTIVDRTSSNRLLASLEVYGALEGDVDFELTGPGEALHRAHAIPRRLDEGRSRVAAEIALEALHPGRYVITAVLRNATGPPSRVSRAFLLIR